MKIMFVLTSAMYYSFFDDVVRSMCAMGHDVLIVSRPGFNPDGNKSGRALLKLLKDAPQVRFENARYRKKRASWVNKIRELANYANFLRPGHPMSLTPQGRDIFMRNRLSPRLAWMAKSRIGTAVLSTDAARGFLRWLESLVLPEREIVAQIAAENPQAIVASPFILTTDLEIEYAKAAKQLNIPVISPVFSWDNLVSKGTYLVKPEWLLVWNQALAAEAVQFHDFDPRNIFITGAPVYDAWFRISPSLDRRQFCEVCGVNSEKPIVVFLGSSSSISDLDAELIRAMLAHYEKMDADRRPSIVIRPHPYSPFDMTVFENDWVKAYPRYGGRPDMDEARQTYFDTLYHSSVVVGINTTGFLDAAIVDKPCVTLSDSKIGYGQFAHFRHLVNAGFLGIATDHAALFELIEKTIHGEDPGRENRRKFVREFIRPRGMDMPASRVLAQAILDAAHGRKPGEWTQHSRETTAQFGNV